MATKKSSGGDNRNSKTGRFVTEAYAKSHPSTTEHERGPHKPKVGSTKKK